MAGSNTQALEASSSRPMPPRAAPAIALLLLAPIVAEVLFGVTHVTTLFILIPQIGTWAVEPWSSNRWFDADGGAGRPS